MNKYIQNIDNDAINELPPAIFDGEIIVVDDVTSMEKAEKILLGQKILGIDTETRPSFSKGIKYKMALLQIATLECALLFRLNKIELSETIVKILNDPKVLKIGAALRDDVKGIQASQSKVAVKGLFDLQNEIAKWGILDKSVKKMAAIVVGVKVSKAQRLSNWEANTLTQAQCMYAAIDAWICLLIYVKLMKL